MPERTEGHRKLALRATEVIYEDSLRIGRPALYDFAHVAEGATDMVDGQAPLFGDSVAKSSLVEPSASGVRKYWTKWNVEKVIAIAPRGNQK